MEELDSPNCALAEWLCIELYVEFYCVVMSALFATWAVCATEGDDNKMCFGETWGK